MEHKYCNNGMYIIINIYYIVYIIPNNGTVEYTYI